MCPLFILCKLITIRLYENESDILPRRERGRGPLSFLTAARCRSCAGRSGANASGNGKKLTENAEAFARPHNGQRRVCHFASFAPPPSGRQFNALSAASPFPDLVCPAGLLRSLAAEAGYADCLDTWIGGEPVALIEADRRVVLGIDQESAIRLLGTSGACRRVHQQELADPAAAKGAIDGQSADPHRRQDRIPRYRGRRRRRSAGSSLWVFR